MDTPQWSCHSSLHNDVGRLDSWSAGCATQWPLRSVDARWPSFLHTMWKRRRLGCGQSCSTRAHSATLPCGSFTTSGRLADACGCRGPLSLFCATSIALSSRRTLTMRRRGGLGHDRNPGQNICCSVCGHLNTCTTCAPRGQIVVCVEGPACPCMG